MPAETQTLPETDKKPRIHKRVHARAKHHYFRVMPDKKRHRIMIWAAFFVISGIIAAQLLYPPDRAVPLARIDGETVGWQREGEITARAEERFQATTIEARIEGAKPREYRLGETGAHLETDRIARAVADYPFWQRYIPFSIMLPRGYVSREAITFTSSVAKEFSEKAAHELSYAPQDARLQIKDGKLEAHAEKAGQTVDAKVLAQHIEQIATASGSKIKVIVPSRQELPTTTSKSLGEVYVQATQALAISLRFTSGDREFVPDENERASWLVLSEDEGGRTQLRFDNEKCAAYLAMIDKEVGAPAGQTHITLVDGHETARREGNGGKTIDTEVVIAAASRHVLEGRGADAIELSLRPTSPQVIYNESYTATEAGLRAYANDAARRYNAAIAIQQVSGSGWSAEARADVSMPSASTYKLYVAKMLFDKMDRGEIKWDDRMMDTTVSGCFDRMVIASTNACAEEWIRQFGRTNINDTLYGLGISRGTTFTSTVATHTTARDLRRFLLGVNDGTIVGGGHRDRLLGALASHSFLQGIPAGSKGRVHDKVGFLWDYTHDAAIVYHPRGTYVMVVMTKGQSYARIAAITREVERIMYP